MEDIFKFNFRNLEFFEIKDNFEKVFLEIKN
jgi:hypothetical protein